MTAPAVRLEHVSKAYRRSAERSNLRAALPGKWGRRPVRDPLLALDDVSLQLDQGDSLAFVGHNGAGKSTLLKLVTRVVAPTRGTVTIRGRVASLLELGVGFHPDLTGRENVYFSAAVLGMGRQDVRRRFDAIVDFSGVEEFLDTPVKRFSSGMLARLGFAVASHVDAEILVVDEVLAVGDADFQRRGFQRMTELRESGAALLFVTHNLWAVSQICRRAVWLEHGRVVATGPAVEVVDHYRAAGLLAPPIPGTAHRAVTLLAVDVRPTSPSPGEVLALDITCRVDRPLPSARAGVSIATPEGLTVVGLRIHELTSRLSTPGMWVTRGQIGPLPLVPGSYRLWVSIYESGEVPVMHDQATVEVVVDGDPPPAGQGLVDCPANWDAQRMPSSAGSGVDLTGRAS